MGEIYMQVQWENLIYRYLYTLILNASLHVQVKRKNLG